MEVTWYGALAMLDLDALSPEQPRPLLRIEYERLAAGGAFEGEHVELLRGQIVTMTPQDAAHINLTARIGSMLVRQLGSEHLVLQQSALALWSHSMPEPDIAVVPYGRLIAHADRAFLVVEVAETSLRKDLHIKAPLYAEAGIPAYWVVDRPNAVVHVLTRPAGGRYTEVAACRSGEILRVEGLAGVAIAVAELFAP